MQIYPTTKNKAKKLKNIKNKKPETTKKPQLISITFMKFPFLIPPAPTLFREQRDNKKTGLIYKAQWCE